MHFLPTFSVGILLAILTACTPRASTTQPVELTALEDFQLPDHPDYSPAYRHKAKNALAINALKYKDRFAIAEHVFNGADGVYRISLTTLQETDGESTYRLYLDGKLSGEVQNAPTTEDYVAQTHDIGKVRLKRGQVIGMAFNSHSNGKIPEGEGFAFSRGRWTKLVLIPVR